MARPRLHDFHPDTLLVAIARVTKAKQEALEADLADARGIMVQEKDAAAAHHAWKAVWPFPSGQAHIDWAKANPDPKRSDAWLVERESESRLKDLAETGIAYDLPLFTGQQLTPSARIAAQKTVRLLEDRGLVTLIGAHARAVLVTDAGWGRFAELQPKQETANA